MLDKDMNKSLKDMPVNSQKDTISIPTPYEAEGFRSGSYTKTHKLITALYMVTDIIDRDEPIRNKLRTLGMEIISDTYTLPSDASMKISQILSFLDIASAVNIISEMNSNILRKEFSELDHSIKAINTDPSLSEFFREPMGADRGPSTFTQYPAIGHTKGHYSSTRIGVQKGSTLLKAINKMSNSVPAPYEAEGFRSGFDVLKKERRDAILNIIKVAGGNSTITDIKSKSTGTLASCSEKTLQRELMSMTKDGVLNKIGEKRWSRYFIK
jgi:hypothetical protein